MPSDLTHGVPPDPFQAEAIEHLLAGNSVLVCAPTGSGKTLIAEAAAQVALAYGRRLYYTTPLKALSNQKFRDFGELFGPEQCGLLTGDVSIRPGAAVVVMTTEVLRNMLLRPGCSHRLERVQFAVFDECHYIGKFGRGTVWEESILKCPPEVQILALSATVPNASEIAGWIDTVHPTTELVESAERPVPLRYFFFRGESLLEIKPHPSQAERRGNRPTLPASRPHRYRRDEAVDPGDLVAVLAERHMLPAIYFLFSRRGCENALLAADYLDLNTTEERTAIRLRIEEWEDQYPSLRSYPFRAELERGLAVHHAGMLPSWRLAVERLFQAKLLKVAFATETLAAGINMPARTTVISSLTRRGDRGIRDLTATEFHQMGGRAGRRGMDHWGNVVVAADGKISRASVEAFASSPPEPLGSVLTPGYGLVLSWLAEYGEEGSHRLIESGLAAYLRYGRRPSHSGTRPGKHSHERPRSPRAVTPIWRRFQAARAVLETYGLLEGEHPTAAGRLVASFQAENELLIARILEGPLAGGIEPAVVAGVMGAIAGAGTRRPAAPGHAIRPARPSQRLTEVLQSAGAIASQVRHAQHSAGFLCPTALSPEFGHLAEMWARGASWDQILDSTDLDEGDVVYTFRNTIDLLNQVESSPAASAVREAARRARQVLDRPPVSEIL